MSMATTKTDESGACPSASIARQRWRLLSRAVANYGEGKTVSLAELNSLTTVRRFCQYGLFNITEVAGNGPEDEFVEQIWQHVDHPDITLKLYLRQRLPVTACLSPLTSLSSGDGNNNNSNSSNSNNTGNICVWPSEEVLAHYVIAQARSGSLLPEADYGTDAGLNVCELGGGLTCLAGLSAGVVLQPRVRRLLLTDGDQLACDNAARCLAANRQVIITAGGCTDARVVQLGWEDAVISDNQKYHLVLCADCLFFRESHRALLNTLDRLLMPASASHCGGLALICAPSRGRSVEAFAQLAASAGFDVHLSDRYDARVSQVATVAAQSGAASFVPDLHLPLMLRLTRRR